jgi:hypothetical protein
MLYTCWAYAWHRWQIEKNLQSENFLLFLLDTFGVVELAYRYIFFFKFILSCQQFDNFSHCLTPVSFTPAANLLPVSLTLVATSINNTSKSGGKICHRCRWYRWCTLTFEKVLMEYSWAGGKLIHENTSSKKPAALGISSFVGPCEIAWADRRVQFGAQKTRDSQRQPSLPLPQAMYLPASASKTLRTGPYTVNHWCIGGFMNARIP